MKHYTTFLFLLIFATSSVFGAVDITTDTAFDAGTHQNQDLNITGATLTFSDTVPGQTQAITYTLSENGETPAVINFAMTNTGGLKLDAAYALSHGANQKLTVQGKGNIVLSETGTLCMISKENGAVTFSLASGSLIDIQKGVFLNGGWGTQDWTANKADMNIAAGAQLCLWDGASVYVNKLTGSGTVNGNDGNLRGPLVVGSDNGTFQFDGTITGSASVKKIGTGTMTLTAANTNKGASATSTAASVESKRAWTISEGTVAVTGAGRLCADGGNVFIDQNGTLEINTTAQHLINSALTGTGTLKLHSIAGFQVATDFAGTLILEGAGELRNYNTTTTFGGNVTLNTTTGGLHPGWGLQSLIMTGKISDGTSNTLNIIADSNTGANASWVVLANENNDFTNLLVNHYCRATSVGALGTGTITINSGKVLDVQGGTIASTRLTGAGTVTNSNADTPLVMEITGTQPAIVCSGNIDWKITAKTAITLTSTSRTGKTIYSGTGTADNRIKYGSGLGLGDIVLDNAMLMNSDSNLILNQNIEITENGGAIRSGWADTWHTDLTGNIYGKGKLTFNVGESGSSPIQLSGNNTYEGGTFLAANTRLVVATNSAFGSGLFDTNGKTLDITFRTGGEAWERVLLAGSYNKTDYGFIDSVTGMNDFANTRPADVLFPYYSTYLYTGVFEATKDLTLQFGKHFDDSGYVAITDLETGDKVVVLDAEGNWTVKSYGEATLLAGKQYQIEVRLGQGIGGVGVASNGTLNGLNNDVNNLVGLGVRLAGNEADANVDTQPFLALNLDADGNLAFSDGSLKIVATPHNWTISNDMKVGTTGATFNNDGLGRGTVSGKITGTGTLNFKNTSAFAQNLGSLAFDGAPASAADTFNVVVGPDTRFTGNGTVGNDLTLNASSTFIIDQPRDTGAMTVLNELKTNGANFEITLDGSTDFYGITAKSADLTGSTFDITYTGAAPEMGTRLLIDFIKTEDGNETWDLTNVHLSAIDPDVRLLAQFANGQYQILAADANTVPEPGTWVLMVLGVFGLAVLRRRRAS